jgi:hypothetical protein
MKKAVLALIIGFFLIAAVPTFAQTSAEEGATKPATSDPVCFSCVAPKCTEELIAHFPQHLIHIYVSFSIGEDGNVSNLRNYVVPAPDEKLAYGLSEEAVKNWHFSPAQIGNTPVRLAATAHLLFANRPHPDAVYPERCDVQVLKTEFENITQKSKELVAQNRLSEARRYVHLAMPPSQSTRDKQLNEMAGLYAEAANASYGTSERPEDCNARLHLLSAMARLDDMKYDRKKVSYWRQKLADEYLNNFLFHNAFRYGSPTCGLEYNGGSSVYWSALAVLSDPTNQTANKRLQMARKRYPAETNKILVMAKENRKLGKLAAVVWATQSAN